MMWDSAKDLIEDCEDLGVRFKWTPDTDVRCYSVDAMSEVFRKALWTDLNKPENLNPLRVRLMALYALRWVN